MVEIEGMIEIEVNRKEEGVTQKKEGLMREETVQRILGQIIKSV